MKRLPWIFCLLVYQLGPMANAQSAIFKDDPRFNRLGTYGTLSGWVQFGLNVDVPIANSGPDTIDGALTNLGDMELGGEVGVEFEVTRRHSHWSFVYRNSSSSEEEEIRGFAWTTHDHINRKIELDIDTFGLRYTWDAGNHPLYLVIGPPRPTFIYIGGGVAMLELEHSETREQWTAWDNDRISSTTLSHESDKTSGYYVECGCYQMLTENVQLGIGARYLNAGSLQFQGQSYNADEKSLFIRIGFFF